MTLDVTIGKLEIKWDERDQEILDDWREEQCLNILTVAEVTTCPEADDNICDPEKTIYPKTSKRSGSTGFWRFWREIDGLEEIYEMMSRYPDSNDKDFALLKPINEEIQQLNESDINREKIRENIREDKARDARLESELYPESVDYYVERQVEMHKSRLKWLKYWSAKAVELYDEKAAIRFF